MVTKMACRWVEKEAMAEMTVGVRELKTHLSEYLRQVKAGQTIVIAEQSRQVGRIVRAEQPLTLPLTWQPRSFGRRHHGCRSPWRRLIANCGRRGRRWAWRCGRQASIRCDFDGPGEE
jgi:prevent-host-death family protein